MLVTDRHRAWLNGDLDDIVDTSGSLELLSELFEHSTSAGDSGQFESPVGMQVEPLGLTREELNSIGGKKILDIGCGQKANLVYWLRELGADAEGIDPRVSNGERYLMKRRFSGMGSSDNGIPRSDGFYDLVIAHSVPPIRHGLSDLKSLARSESNPSADIIVKGTMMVLEALRVLDSRGEFACWPALSRTGHLSPFLAAGGWEMKKVPVYSSMPLSPQEYDLVGDVAYRTEIRKG